MEVSNDWHWSFHEAAYGFCGEHCHPIVITSIRVYIYVCVQYLQTIFFYLVVYRRP